MQVQSASPRGLQRTDLFPDGLPREDMPSAQAFRNIMSTVRSVITGDLTALITSREDGSLLLQSQTILSQYPKTLLERLQHWAKSTPDKTYLAERDKDNPDKWKRITYAETWQSIRHIASGLLQHNLSVDRPIAVLSGNSIEHALLGLAAMYIGVPYASISEQYSLVSQDHEKLRYVLGLITPGLVFADDGNAYQKAINTTIANDVIVLTSYGEYPDKSGIKFSDLLDHPIDSRIETIHSALKADDIAKFLFSSGSTGKPKAVINTHRMLCSNQQMIRQALPLLQDPPPILVDWLPWNHTFGGNHNFGIVLYNGGTLYIDKGKPTPQGFLESVRNLKEIAPTVFYNVPRGFEELVKHLRQDDELCRVFFSQMRMFFYAGAGLSQPVWNALDELALKTCDERILILTGLGCTETSPSALFTTNDGGFAGLLGLPVPGTEVKLVKVGEKTEIRVRGPNVTPGYWRNPEITQKAFDEEGYYCTGDAVRFVDPLDPQQGLMFDGRISEDFKLDTGTWVSAGPLRAQFLNHFGNIVKDVVIVGRDRPFVSALVFPDIDNCRLLVDNSSGLSDLAIVNHPAVRERFGSLLQSFSKDATGSASKVVRLSLQVTPPSLDQNEITDKGSLNAGAIQDHRHASINHLYCDTDCNEKNDNILMKDVVIFLP